MKCLINISQVLLTWGKRRREFKKIISVPYCVHNIDRIKNAPERKIDELLSSGEMGE